ncbi:MAG TPA: hypothetical protein VKX49_25545 [Bryobacteraceae bacterium]|nr:hypothetical protein [Bryobacteraceae bacterium]
MQTRHFVIAGLIALTSLQGANSVTKEGTDAGAAFTRLKTLAGEWKADTPQGQARLTYETTAGGTVLVERDTAENMLGMMTMYFVDGNRLLLTHYCMAGNQPRMQARSFNAQTGEVQFQFLDATNLANSNAGHMHNARIRILDNNHFDAEWQFFENGAPKMTETFHYTRVR